MIENQRGGSGSVAFIGNIMHATLPERRWREGIIVVYECISHSSNMKPLK
jgi:hypothetical protein